MSDETPETDAERTPGEGEVSEFEALAREIEDDPGGPSFPRLAEAYRRAGQTERAQEIAFRGLSASPERMSGRVALALALLDNGDVTEAMRELSSIMENIPSLPADSLEPESAVSSEPIHGEHRLYTQPLAAPSSALPSFDEPSVSGGDDAQTGGEARAENEAASLGGAASEALREEEIDRAIDSAQAEADQMISANRLAEAALEEVVEGDEMDSPIDRPVFSTETMASVLEGQGDRERAERIRASIPSLNIDEPDGSEARSTTVPEILRPAAFDSESVVAAAPESLGEADAAKLPDEPDVAPEATRKEEIIHRLESWIANIRREVA